MNSTQFLKDLEEIINKNSMESQSDTPDYILAEYLENCLNNFGTTIQKRGEWYGREPKADATPRAILNDPLPPHILTAIGEAVGTASVCWNPKPEGTFDTDNALKVADGLANTIRNWYHPKFP